MATAALRLLTFVFAVLAAPAFAQDPVGVQQVGMPPTPPAAPIALDQVPPDLRAWVPWITSRHPELACPLTSAGRACLWPGALTVDARADGASLELGARVDAALPLPLPGGAGAWPQDVAVDGRPAAVLDAGGVPVVVLAPGDHRVTARIPWTVRPASLRVPAATGRIALTVDGESIAWPRIDADGLRLGAAPLEEREGERLEIEVSRRIRDGVPVVVDTVVVLRASGAGRELDLGLVGLPGTAPVSLSATLPARFTPERSLVVQLRPGTWEVRFESVHDGPVTELRRPPRVDPWPEVEHWAFAADDRTRAVNLSGPPGVDPARTTIPGDWRTLPVFAVDEQTALGFEELRRGEPEPPPNQLHLSREIWVDHDGGGLTLRDRFTGVMHRDWRLEVVAPARLGHLSAQGMDQVITQIEGRTEGVDLRAADVSVVAESRIDGRPTALPAVGWGTDVQSLDAVLHLPPGWTLLAGTGIDNLDGSVLDRWTLFDLFFVLVLGLATARLLGRGWGALALIGLALARHEADAPQWTWAVLLVLVALARVVDEGWPGRAVALGRVVCLLALAVQIVPFSVNQIEVGLFPALAREWQTPSDGGVNLQNSDSFGYAQEVPADPYLFSRGEPAKADSWSGGDLGKVGRKSYLSSQVDPSAIVQTGPGVPTWSWDIQPLRWSGPVAHDHTMRLFLLGPTTNLFLALVRVALLALLALELAGARRWKLGPAARAVPAALALLLLLPITARAQPSPELLRELEARLLVPPACAPRCADVARATMAVTGDRLVYEAEVHAATASSWPVPGPTGVWVPASVTLDGAATSALARMADGFLHVRVEPGVHRVRVEGPLPPSDVVALAFGLAPKHLSWSGDGWALDGLRADGSVDASVQLARMLGETSTAQSAENLSPWLELHRELDLGVPWRVKTTLVRVGPSDYPVTVKVPLLPGEAVTDGGFEPVSGLVSVTLDRDVRELSWLSTLDETDAVALAAPVGVPWSEVWTLSCGPMYRCADVGPAPLEHVVGGAWSPRWRPWPGEVVTVNVTRPPGVAGQTTTIDRAELVVRPGRRQLVAELTLSIRSSQGGRQVLTLPEGSSLQSVLVQGQSRPLQLRDDHQLHLPLQPGTQEVKVSWQQPDPPTVFDRVPLVDLGGPAVNVTVVVEPMLERWIAALRGPRWGPVPQMWSYVVIVLLIAPLLARAPWSPLATWQWALLGLGMTQVPVVAPMVIVGWLLSLGWRKEHPHENAWVFDLIQLGLVVLTVVALGLLYVSIHAGLLWQPDLQVAGNGSHEGRLVWFLDRSEGEMPRPILVTFPMWTWRVGMLIWSLWLAGSLVRWLPWAFRAWTSGGWYKIPPPPPPRERKDASAPPTPEAPVAAGGEAG